MAWEKKKRVRNFIDLKPKFPRPLYLGGRGNL